MLHKKIKFVVGTLRVVAAAALMSQYFYMAGLLFIAAEILGIIKELI